MIHEAMTKYDAEIAKCTDYYAKQCALMEIARGQISAANFIAASSRGLILDAQGVINQMEKDIPATKKELKDHNSKCKGELHKMNERLKVLMGDIAVMTMILKMSDCDAKGFVQMHELAMLRCQDQCSHKGVVTFNHNELQSQVDKLQSTTSKDLMAETFADMFEGAESDDSVQFVQVDGSEYQAVVNKTKFNNPPVHEPKCHSTRALTPTRVHLQPAPVQSSGLQSAHSRNLLDATSCREGSCKFRPASQMIGTSSWKRSKQQTVPARTRRRPSGPPLNRTALCSPPLKQSWPRPLRRRPLLVPRVVKWHRRTSSTTT